MARTSKLGQARYARSALFDFPSSKQFNFIAKHELCAQFYETVSRNTINEYTFKYVYFKFTFKRNETSAILVSYSSSLKLRYTYQPFLPREFIHLPVRT